MKDQQRTCTVPWWELYVVYRVVWHRKLIKYRNLRFNHLSLPIHLDKFKDRFLQILVLVNFIDDGNKVLFVPTAGNRTVRTTLTGCSMWYSHATGIQKLEYRTSTICTTYWYVVRSTGKVQQCRKLLEQNLACSRRIVSSC